MARRLPDPEGIAAISRWLSAAKPPVMVAPMSPIPMGSQRRSAATPPGNAVNDFHRCKTGVYEIQAT